MANYTLNILRNKQEYSSKEAAIEALSRFTHHSYGQPITVLYRDPTNRLRLLFAVGIKNADEQTDVKFGEDFYEIINDVDGAESILFWKKYQDQSIVPSEGQFAPVSISESDFQQILDNYLPKYDNHIFFVEKEDENHNKIGFIYKGNVIYSNPDGLNTLQKYIESLEARIAALENR